ncbi:hypothetical protein HDU92_005835 [Lobulomyces angularis]|nr:hypothetical protein HDU92_005835 [Lobulomyces angularis]
MEGFEVASKIWTEINLTVLQKSLDTQSTEILENQKEGLNQRKKLSEQTKEFKKVPDSLKLNEFKNLLKAYQNEIDSITKRSKFAETSYLNVYKVIADAPDPSPFINAAIEKSKRIEELNIVEAENKKLKEELNELNIKLISSSKNEKEVQTLKERLKNYEAKLNDMVQEKVNLKEQELRLDMNDKIRIYKETEYSLQRQLQQTKDQLITIQNSHDMTQAKLSDNTQKYDDKVAAKLAELDIVVMDFEQSQLKVAQLTRDNELLKKELAGTNDLKNEKLELEEKMLKVQEVEYSRLYTQVEKLQTELSELKSNFSNEKADMLKKNKTLVHETEELTKKLKSMEDYDKLKRELDILKSIEFPDTNFDTEWGEQAVSNVDTSYTLERLMLDRNKKLQNEITTLKMSLNDLNIELEAKTFESAENLKKNEELNKLVKKLEEDLFNLNSVYEKKKISNSNNEKFNEDPLSSIVESMIDTNNVNTPLGLKNSPMFSQTQGNENSSIVPILTSQRDRYRQRNAELEEQIREHVERISELCSKVETLKNENIKLYEKLKFTQSFNYSNSSAGRESVSNNLLDNEKNLYNNNYSNNYEDNYGGYKISRNNNSRQKEDYIQIDNKYKTIYEGSLDPFQRFHKQEEAKRITRLNPAERVALNLTKLIFLNKYSRWLFILYSFLLHILVIFTLYHLSNWEECKVDHS